MSVWRDRARRRIAELPKDLPADATLQERRQLRLPMAPLPHLAGHPTTLTPAFERWDARWMQRD